jgi:Glutamine phosphoribosylpyrophosphate amidotransferase
LSFPSKKQFFLNQKTFLQLLKKPHLRINGAYAVVALITGYGIVAFRESSRDKTFNYLELERVKNKNEYVVSSETTLFSATRFQST